MNVLVTGGAGFIGSHTADALIRAGHNVRVLDSLEPPVHLDRKPPPYLNDRIELLVGDVREEGMLLRALHGCDVVFHMAAFQDYLPVFSRYTDVNVTSTALIYELIVREKLPIRKVVVASSQATLGEGMYRDGNGRLFLPDMRPDAQLKAGDWEIKAPNGYRDPIRWVRTNESVANPQNPYGISKISEEKIAVHLGKRYEIPSVAMRYSIVQGPRQSFYNAYSGACRIFCLSFYQDVEPPIFEDGEQIRDFVNINDVIDANLIVLEDSRADYQVYNVGGDQPITINQFARAVAEAFQRSDYRPRPCGTYRYGDTRHICSDVSKLGDLGWKPIRTVSQSVEDYRAWLESVDVDRGALSHCANQMAASNVVRRTLAAESS